ncbi:hypothetical protein U1Q18_007477, partial [Sarracenia purpurea var. burkii]
MASEAHPKKRRSKGHKGESSNPRLSNKWKKTSTSLGLPPQIHGNLKPPTPQTE